MSLLKAHRRFWVAFIAATLAAPLLSACGGSGFQPLYGSGGLGANAAAGLKQVQISPIPGRVGQRIRNELLFDTDTGEGVIDSKYRLEIAIRETVSSTIVDRTGESEGRVYNLDASFQLLDSKSGAILLTGESYARAPYERFTSIFANVRARKDAEDRAARVISTDLRTRLAAFLATSA